jgi:hypothetical protein
MGWIHIPDHDLERYYLGKVTAEEDLATLEEHILACTSCAERAEATQDYVDAVRAAACALNEPCRISLGDDGADRSVPEGYL